MGHFPLSRCPWHVCVTSFSSLGPFQPPAPTKLFRPQDEGDRAPAPREGWELRGWVLGSEPCLDQWIWKGEREVRSEESPGLRGRRAVPPLTPSVPVGTTFFLGLSALGHSLSTHEEAQTTFHTFLSSSQLRPVVCCQRLDPRVPLQEKPNLTKCRKENATGPTPENETSSVESLVNSTQPQQVKSTLKNICTYALVF